MFKKTQGFARKVIIGFVISTQVFIGLLFAGPVKAGTMESAGSFINKFSGDSPIGDVVNEAADKAASKLGYPVVVTTDLGDYVEMAWQSIYEASLNALMGGFSHFMNQLAYDTALYVTSGGSGQGALVFQDGFGSYLEKTFEASTMAALGELEDHYGINLCEPNTEIKFFLNVGIQDLLLPEIGPPTPPACTWQKMSKGWSNAYYQTVNQLEGILDAPPIEVAFLESANLADSDFGIAFGAIDLVRKKAARDTEGAKNERLEGNGFKPVKDLVSGAIVTPAHLIGEEAEGLTGKSFAQINNTQVAGLYGSQALNVVIGASGIFLNNVASQMLKKIMQEGLLPVPIGDSSSFGSAGLGDYRRAAESAFSFFFTSVPTKQLNAYSLETIFAACPDNPGLNNCVIDSGMQRILQIAKQGTPLTVQEAVDQGMLDPNKPFISPKRLLDHNDVKTCYLKGFCYSNLQKLRKVRVLPVGFELAALRSDPDNLQAWTLGKVMAGFEDCTRDGDGKAIFDIAKPFCHLVDPNWTIKIPETRCESLVNGPELLDSNISNRKEECVDVSTCVTEGENGECLGDFGYCTEEKNVWRIEGETCPAEYTTCRNYVAQSGEINSYLSRTVDYGECRAESVGCRAYSTEKSGDIWTSSADASSRLKNLGRNQTIYFGSEINASTCPANAAGCSAFYTLNQEGEKGRLTYLKKAPDYLTCYDTQPATPEIDWPTTKADLSLLTNNDKCDAYAEVCLPEEVACDLYTPLAGGPELSGVIGNNICASECVGYDTFRQESTSFAPEEYPLYLIPTNGDVCSAQYAGCDEFTNIEAGSAGGETLEYYSDFKQCEKPDSGNDKVFYSWEGSVSEGFVLKVHHLSPIDDARNSYIQNLSLFANAKNDLVVGSPAYSDDTAQSLKNNYKSCNEKNYNILINDPFSIDSADEDCRAFYDDEGEVFYRLFAKTITVSNSCHKIRKTESRLFVDNTIGDQNSCDLKNGVWDGASCERCFNGGSYENGACIYQTISSPSESNSCPVSVNGCRAYVGNAGNNIREIMFDSFEPFDNSPNALLSAREGWDSSDGTGLSVVGEATQAGLHSLQVNSDIISREFDAGDITPNSFYELSFWSRGVPQNLDIIMKDDSGLGVSFTVNSITNSTALVSIGDNWKEYKLGPVEFKGAGVANIEFTRSAIGSTSLGVYFIDNARLTKVNDFTYLVKDSWQTSEGYNVPLSCDNTPEDSLPGFALGCEAFNDQLGTTYYATGFENLCRVEAVGCEPLLDTFNTTEGQDSELAQIFNAWCEGGVGECTISVDEPTSDRNNTQIQKKINIGSCNVDIDQDGCYISKIIVPSHIEIGDLDYVRVETTVIIPADTSIENPIYLTNSQKYKCSPQKLGCQEVALESHILPSNQPQAFEFSEQFVLSNPNNYQETLCQSDQVGCGEFRSDKNISYFVDPKITGGSVCVYKSIGASGSDNYGWFLDGIGSCSSGNGDLCKVDDDCSGDTNICENVGSTACYDGYIKQGGELGIWSNESVNYDGFVGACEQQYNACTELVDPADTSNNADGKSYFVVYDEKMQDQSGECGGQVSQNDGCVLFDKTDNPNKIYNSVETYKNSEDADPKFGPVNPVMDGVKDTNVILKVNRDRECSEWLACKTSVPFTDEKGVRTELCYQYDLCNESLPGVGCISWVGDDNENITLSPEEYVVRGTSWYDNEYTGYSLLNKYPVQDFVYVDFDLSDDADKELDDEFGDSLFLGYEFVPAPSFEQFGCVLNGVKKEQFQVCGLTNGGICTDNGQCIKPTDGAFIGGIEEKNEKSFRNSRLVLETLDVGICKSFPEKDSPFGFDIVVNSYKTLITNGVSATRKRITDKKRVFSGANTCQDGECSCEYKKVSYGGSVVDYWPLTKSDQEIPGGVCASGSLGGNPCNYNSDCSILSDEGLSSYGSCIKRFNTERRIGLRGFCLEYDLSRPIGNGEYACLTWLPVDASASKIDLHNYYPEAGYYPVPEYDAPNGGGEVYCTQSTSRGAGEYDEGMYIFKNFGDLDSISGELNPPSNNDKFDNIFLKTGKAVKNPYIDSFSGFTYFTHPYIENYVNKTSDSNGKENFYSLMQSWAWKYINTNARILRLELNGNGFSGRASGDKDTTDPYKQYFFAPQVYNTAGVAMHSPRIWDDTVLGMEYYYYTQFKTGANDDLYDDRNIFTDSMSAEKTAGLEDDLYISPIQKTLIESEFEKVYFVGLKHVNNYEQGITPALLTTDFSLNIKELKQRLEDNKPNNESIFKSGVSQALGSHYSKNLMLDDNLGVTWSYVLERTGSSSECGGLFSYCDYVNNEFILNYNNPEVNGIRNQINRRYVIVFFEDIGRKGERFLPVFVNKNGPPLNSTQDPFSAGCVDGQGGYLAIGMDFNRGGEFLGYISKWCNSTKSSGTAGIQLATIATLNDYCTEFTSVYNPDEDTTNKAWTDRVWKYARENRFVTPYRQITLSTLLQPFGSTLLSMNNLNKYDGSGDFTEKYVLNNPIKGVPYMCDYSNFTVFDLKNYACLALNNVGYPDSLTSKLSEASARFAPAGYEFGKDAIQAIFAKIFTPSIEEGLSELDSNWDKEILITSELRDLYPPQIYSLNPDKCFNINGKSQTCVGAEKNSITVNGKNGTLLDYNGDGFPDEDKDKNGETDSIIGVGNKSVSLNFFAWADDNRMPIRRIMVDWSDNSLITNENKMGFYKNKKPFCGGETAENVKVCVNKATRSDIEYIKTGLTCQEDSDCSSDNTCRDIGASDNFGSSSRACEEGYFEFGHSYTCGPEDEGKDYWTLVSGEIGGVANFTSGQRDQLSKFGVGANDYVCVFQPKVQVLDNWGWCNTSDGTGQYNDDNFDCDFGNSEVWTYYKNKIIIIPPKKD
ncbi:MAG: hypothetical protein L3J07_00135 [Candidatus Magasanikbacteria bacterium]|nr:hypothetical protein [Candidatus Magasanikbacteria bacterium]